MFMYMCMYVQFEHFICKHLCIISYSSLYMHPRLQCIDVQLLKEKKIAITQSGLLVHQKEKTIVSKVVTVGKCSVVSEFV